MNLLEDFSGSVDHTGEVLLLDHFAGIGDLLWRTTLHRELKRRNPYLKLYVSSGGPHWKLLYRTNPYIDKLVDRIGDPPYLSEVDHYITDLLCPHTISSYSFRLDALDALEIWSGLKIRDKSYVYKVLDEEDIWAEKFIERAGATCKPKVGVVLKASTWIRTWPGEYTKKIIKYLIYRGCHVFIMDNHPAPLHGEGITNLCGGYNVREIAAIVSKMDLMIVPDSGLMHFAGHFRIPTIALFGGTDPKCRVKYYTTVKPVLSSWRCPDWPCWLHEPFCPRGIPAPCMSSLLPEIVMEEINRCLSA